MVFCVFKRLGCVWANRRRRCVSRSVVATFVDGGSPAAPSVAELAQAQGETVRFDEFSGWAIHPGQVGACAIAPGLCDAVAARRPMDGLLFVQAVIEMARARPILRRQWPAVVSAPAVDPGVWLVPQCQ